MSRREFLSFIPYSPRISRSYPQVAVLVSSSGWSTGENIDSITIPVLRTASWRYSLQAVTKSCGIILVASVIFALWAVAVSKSELQIGNVYIGTCLSGYPDTFGGIAKRYSG